MSLVFSSCDFWMRRALLAESPKYPPLNEYLMAPDVEIALGQERGSRRDFPATRR